MSKPLSMKRAICANGKYLLPSREEDFHLRSHIVTSNYLTHLVSIENKNRKN